MLRLVPDHLKTEKKCKNVVRKVSLPIRYIPD